MLQKASLPTSVQQADTGTAFELLIIFSVTLSSFICSEIVFAHSIFIAFTMFDICTLL